MTVKPPRRYRCRHRECPNTYTEVIGGEQAFGKHFAGAECLPCFYAVQLHENGQTPEQIEGVPQMMALFEPHLSATGWTWQDVKNSYVRLLPAGPSPQEP